VGKGELEMERQRVKGQSDQKNTDQNLKLAVFFMNEKKSIMILKGSIVYWLVLEIVHAILQSV